MTEAERKAIDLLHTWALPRTPVSRIVQSENWFQLISEDYLSPAFNEVIFSCFDSEEELSAKVKSTIAEY